MPDLPCLEVIPGAGDVAAIAAGAAKTVVGAPALRAISRGQETVLEPTAGGAPIGWFPEAIYPIATHPAGRSWAGNVGNHLYLLALENAPPPAPY